MTDFKEEGFKIDALDLSGLSPGPEDDHRVYNHDGTSTITLTDGSTTSRMGWYMWSDPDGAWFPMGQHADLVDGYHGADLAALAENETVSGQWDFGDYLKIIKGGPFAQFDATGSDHGYMEYYWDSANPSIRSAYIGNGSSSHNKFSIINELGNTIELGGANVNVTNGYLDVTGGNAYVSGTRVQEGEHNPVSIPMTKWADGLASEEIHRIKVPIGKKLYLYALDLQMKGGGSSTSLSVDFYDSTNATQIASDTAGGGANVGEPLGSSGDGSVVLVRLSNSTGSYQNASIQSNVVIK